MDVLFINPDSSTQAYLDLVEKRFGTQQRRNVEDMSSIQLKRRVLEE